MPASKPPSPDRAGTARSVRASPGIALFAVLWVSGLLAVLAVGFGSSGRTEVRLAMNIRANAEAMALADAGVERAVLELLNNPAPAARSAERVIAFALGEGRVRVLLSDEDGKIDLNIAPLPLLAGLLRAVGLAPDQAATLAARIGDYRDDDHDPEPGGAEDAAYVAAGFSQGAADRPLQTETELLNVLGIDDQLFARIRPHVTVYSGAEGVDPLRASATVLRAVPGMTEEAVAQILAGGPDHDPVLDLPEDVLLEAEPYLLPSRELVYGIQSLGQSADGGRFVREAVLALDAGTEDLPFGYYAWRRGELSAITTAE
jgi:general secretion pathway protein K